MPQHMTVRMAWHDNNWDGRVCKEPEKNHYCVGSHSLLSERLARKRDLEIESKNAGKKLDELGDYIPPCFWTSNAFSDKQINIRHNHPFTRYENSHYIDDTLSGYSVFTWPFRLSFNHTKHKQDRYGSYPPDLDERIEQFLKQFSLNNSIVFFYLNYDNPISADENKYALVGCATLKQITCGKHFDFAPEEMKKLTRQKTMKHLSTLNWAISISYDFADNGIRLPYKDYLEYIKENPEDETMLDEIKILIDHDMAEDFKYVATDIGDDSCIYLLTQLQKSFSKIKEHAIMPKDWIQKQQETVEQLLERSWKMRGLYPGLGNVLDVISGNTHHFGKGDDIVELIQRNAKNKNVLEETFSLISNQSNIPEYLTEHAGMFTEIQANFQKEKETLLKKLSLFSFTQGQISNIQNKNKESFKSPIDIEKIVSNPYLLCEEYVSSYPDLDEIIIHDKPIETFTIDIGMFPNSTYLVRDVKLQNLAPNSPERLRAIIRDYLKGLEHDGDCYAPLVDIYNYIMEFPLFYREEINLPQDDLVLNEKYQTHFAEKLHTVQNRHGYYIYLNEIYQAEQFIKNKIQYLLERKDKPSKILNLEGFLEGEANKLELDIKNFPRKQFCHERKKLVEGAITKSLFVILGKPGSGKTQALKKVIAEIKNNDENVTLLAPTGKAALRLKEATGEESAKTIDRLIYAERWDDILDDFENFILPNSHQEPIIQNLIIDESSMLDIKKLAILLKMITNEKNEIWTKRIIFVGDENQLPPIGYGRPFFDIIQFIRSNEKYKDNLVELSTNCRQKFDNEIIKIAEIFKGGNKYYEETLDAIIAGTFSTDGFTVQLWDDEDDLFDKLDARIEDVIEESLVDAKVPTKKDSRLNLLFGLEETGNVKNGAQPMSIDNFQILSPYRGGYFGTVGLNIAVKSRYRNIHPLDASIYSQIPFTHSDKIIATENQYRWNSYKRMRDLILSNGSMGVVNNISESYPQRRFYFSDLNYPLKTLPGGSEKYELAYAITIHKSQGSEFNHVFVIIPKKKALLSRELIYTALTRSTGQVTLFLQNDSGDNIRRARQRSDILPRLTSIFSLPEDYRRQYEPESGIFVRSKIEYILFKELKARNIDFEYEKVHYFEKGNKNLRPDFTIKIGGKEYFLEHLGMLDRQDYVESWTERRKIYEQNSLSDMLVTTDDLDGIKEGKIDKLVSDLLNQTLDRTEKSTLSLHHYALN